MARGDACESCHEGEEAEIGDKLVSGKRLEPMPVKGKNGHVELALQVAYDDDYAYFRARWKTQNAYPGYAHPYFRFDGKKWKAYGHPKLDKVVQDGKQPGIYEDRFSIMVDDGSVPGFAKQGCWLTCHNGERDMPNLASKAAVKANPVLGDMGKKKHDVRKYLELTRNGGGWNDTKSKAEIAKLKAAGKFLDLFQWRGHRSNPVGMSDDFYVLEYRNQDSGKGPFSKNWDKKKHQPKYMYDAAKFGSSVVHMDQIRKIPTALIREKNAVPFDPSVKFKAGDMVPEYLLSRVDTKGSAGDNNMSKGVWKDHEWTMVEARKLNLKNADDKALMPGKVYNMGFAIHDDNITTRGHFVSFPMTVGFGVKARIQAVKVK